MNYSYNFNTCTMNRAPLNKNNINSSLVIPLTNRERTLLASDTYKAYIALGRGFEVFREHLRAKYHTDQKTIEKLYGECQVVFIKVTRKGGMTGDLSRLFDLQ